MDTLLLKNAKKFFKNNNYLEAINCLRSIKYQTKDSYSLLIKSYVLENNSIKNYYIYKLFLIYDICATCTIVKIYLNTSNIEKVKKYCLIGMYQKSKYCYTQYINILHIKYKEELNVNYLNEAYYYILKFEKIISNKYDLVIYNLILFHYYKIQYKYSKCLEYIKKCYNLLNIKNNPIYYDKVYLYIKYITFETKINICNVDFCNTICFYYDIYLSILDFKYEKTIIKKLKFSTFEFFSNYVLKIRNILKLQNIAKYGKFQYISEIIYYPLIHNSKLLIKYIKEFPFLKIYITTYLHIKKEILTNYRIN